MIHRCGLTENPALVECLIPVLFDPDSDGDRALLQSVCTYWITFINNSLQMSKLEMVYFKLFTQKCFSHASP